MAGLFDDVEFGDMYVTKGGYKAVYIKKQKIRKHYEYQFVAEIDMSEYGEENGSYTFHVNKNGTHKDKSFCIDHRI